MKNKRTLAVLTALMLWLLAFLFAIPPVAAAYQIPGLTSSAPAASPQPSAAPADPLGRENPRSCILGFIKAAQEERYSVAIQYFQPPITHRRHAVEDEEELASQFLTILNEKFGGPLDFLSRDPQGRLDDGLPPDQEKLNGALGASDKYTILLVRIEDEHGRKLWYVARSTLDHVPEMYDALAFPEVEKQIPRVLVENRFLSMPYWQWLAILLFIPVAWLAGRLIRLLAGGILRAWRKRRGLPVPPARRFLSIDPVTLALAILIHYLLVSYVGTSLLYRLYYRKVIWILLTVAFYWILTWVTRSIARRIGASLTSRGMLAQRSIVSLVRRFTEVVIFLFLALTVLHSLGMDVTTALAGVGIGGLALGLGAQKTFENMFGGISLLFDKVIQVGDVCKVGTQVGTVEDIGLRSTRLRTAERTLLSVPNGIMATVTLENFRFRDKFLCQQVIRLRYDLSPDHVRYVLNEIWQLLKQNPKVEETSARVRFLRFAEYALEIELFCYILEAEYDGYLATQEALLLAVMDTLEKAGAVVALPTQTTLVSKDAWVDSEKAEAIKAAVEKVRDPGVLGPSEPPSS